MEIWMGMLSLQPPLSLLSGILQRQLVRRMTKAQLVFDAQVHSSLYSQPECGTMEKAKDQSLFSPFLLQYRG